MRLAALVLIGVLLPASPAAAKPCKLHARDKVVTATKSAVIARRPNGHLQSTYRGCLKSAGRWRTLVVGRYDGSGGDIPGQAALGGRYAAVAVFSGSHYGSGSTWVQIVNLRTGGRRQALVVHVNDGSVPTEYGLLALAVSRYATLGWIAADYAVPNPPSGYRETVNAHDAAGTRVLDTAEDVNLGALKFRGPTLHWTHGGEPREASLGPE
jgi:hypothetical protein